MRKKNNRRGTSARHRIAFGYEGPGGHTAELRVVVRFTAAQWRNIALILALVASLLAVIAFVPAGGGS